MSFNRKLGNFRKGEGVGLDGGKEEIGQVSLSHFTTSVFLGDLLLEGL
jgi:hypothetical protein